VSIHFDAGHPMTAKSKKYCMDNIKSRCTVWMIAIMTTSSANVETWRCSGSSSLIGILGGMRNIEEINASARASASADLTQALMKRRSDAFVR
jgi:hypothetical protein